MAGRIVIPVNGIYFDQIKSGEKVEEYRLANAYWARRLEGRSYDEVELTRGYPARDDGERRLVRRWKGFVRKTIAHPHFGDAPVEVYAIDVSTPAGGL